MAELLNKKKVLDCTAKSEFVSRCMDARVLLDEVKQTHIDQMIVLAETYVAGVEAIMAEIDS